MIIYTQLWGFSITNLIVLVKNDLEATQDEPSMLYPLDQPIKLLYWSMIGFFYPNNVWMI